MYMYMYMYIYMYMYMYTYMYLSMYLYTYMYMDMDVSSGSVDLNGISLHLLEDIAGSIPRSLPRKARVTMSHLACSTRMYMHLPIMSVGIRIHTYTHTHTQTYDLMLVCRTMHCDSCAATLQVAMAPAANTAAAIKVYCLHVKHVSHASDVLVYSHKYHV